MDNNTNNGASAKSEGILESGAIVKSMGCYDSRVVLRKVNTQYVTHIQVFPHDREDSTPYFVWGHYFQNIDDALNDYKERCKTFEGGA